jgi:hypothetical protein
MADSGRIFMQVLNLRIVQPWNLPEAARLSGGSENDGMERESCPCQVFI